jgi:hypothetical protein
MAPARRQGAQDRARFAVVATVVERIVVSASPRFVTIERDATPCLGVVPIIFARSSRGPPVS